MAKTRTPARLQRHSYTFQLNSPTFTFIYYVYFLHFKCLYRRLKLHHIAYWKFPSMNLSLVSNEYLSNCPYRKSLVTLSQPPDKIYVLVSFTSAVTTNIQSQHHHPIGQSLLPKRSLCSHWLRPQIRQH